MSENNNANKLINELTKRLGISENQMQNAMKSGNIDVKCVSNFRVTIFDTKEKYIEYHQSTRFTGGEEDEAIEKTSSMSEYVYEDDIISLTLTDGMIVMIEYGTGTYSIDEGPVIN